MLHGHLHEDFRPLARLLERQILTHGGGAALCVYHRGEKVVDLWGGVATAQGEPWQASTLALSYSTGKGVLALLIHRLVNAGLLHYDDPVCQYWPEFAANGKATVTLRHLLCHEAGLYSIRAVTDDAHDMLDWSAMVRRLAAARPEHPPGQTWGYHALTLGWLLGHLAERATGHSLAALMHDWVTAPLALDGCYFGLPELESHRCADLLKTARPPHPGTSPWRSWWHETQKRGVHGLHQMIGFPTESIAAGLEPQGIQHFDFNSAAVRSACIPAANGIFTARSLARVYALFAEGGVWRGETLLHTRIIEQIQRVHHRGMGRVIAIPLHWRLGYHRVFSIGRQPTHAYGHFGYGGSGAWADPSRRLSLAMTVNRGSGTPMGDLRLPRLNACVLNLVDQRS